jgi:hypothetical protein
MEAMDSSETAVTANQECMHMEEFSLYINAREINTLIWQIDYGYLSTPSVWVRNEESRGNKEKGNKFLRTPFHYLRNSISVNTKVLINTNESKGNLNGRMAGTKAPFVEIY